MSQTYINLLTYFVPDKIDSAVQMNTDEKKYEVEDDENLDFLDEPFPVE